MLRMVNEIVIRDFMKNSDIGKMILYNPDVQNSTLVLEKNSQSGKVSVSNRFVYSQYHAERLSLGQHHDPEQIIHLAHMMGCTHYDPEVMKEDVELANYNKRMIDTLLNNQRTTS